MAGGDPAVGHHLLEGHPDHVLGLLVDSDRPGQQVGLGPVGQLGDLGLGGVADVRSQRLAVFVLVGGSPVVDRRVVAFLPGEEVLHRVVDAVEAEVGRDAVGDLVPLAVAVGRVAQDVDEAGGHHEPGGINGRGARDRLEADARDRVAVDAHVGHGVEVRVRVDDPATRDHHVVDVGVVDDGEAVVEHRWDVGDGPSGCRRGGCRGRRGSGGGRVWSHRRGWGGGTSGREASQHPEAGGAQPEPDQYPPTCQRGGPRFGPLGPLFVRSHRADATGGPPPGGGTPCRSGGDLSGTVAVGTVWAWKVGRSPGSRCC